MTPPNPWVFGVVGGLVLVVLSRRHPKNWPPVAKKQLGAFDVYVINLDTAAKRLTHFTREFSGCDLRRRSVIRVPAVDGRTLDIDATVSAKANREIMDAERTGFRLRHYQLSRGAVGCYLSHTRLWESVLATDKEVALIFEDDAQIHPEIGAFLRTTPVPEDFDIILLGYVCFKCAKDEAAGFVRVRRFFGLHGYLISRKGIKKILARPEISPVRKQIDTVLSDLAEEGHITVYAAPKKLVEQANETFRTQIQIPIRGDVDPWAALKN